MASSAIGGAVAMDAMGAQARAMRWSGEDSFLVQPRPPVASEESANAIEILCAILADPLVTRSSQLTRSPLLA